MQASTSGDSSAGRRRGQLLLLMAGFAALLLVVNFQSLKMQSEPLSSHRRTMEEGAVLGGSAFKAGGLPGAENFEVQGGQSEGASAAAAAGPAVGGRGLPATSCTIAELISEPAHVRGPVQKQGLLNLDQWHRNRSHVRMERWTNWKRERKRRVELEVQGQRQAADEPLQAPPVYPACHVFINHRYRFIYLRHPKAASTSLLAFFGKCVDGASPYNSTCIEPLFTQAVPPEELEPIWSSYTVFTFVRNPWDRAVSAYKMMMRYLEWEIVPPGAEGGSSLAAEAAAADGRSGLASRGQGSAAAAGAEGEEAVDEEEGAKEGQQWGSAGEQQQQYRYKVPDARQYGWDNFCADPISFDYLCRQDNKCKSRGRTFVPLHLLPQAPCVLAASGGWAVDFVGSVERIDEDLHDLLSLLEQRVSGEGLPALPRLPKPLPNINGRGSRSASKKGCEGMNASASADAELPEPYCEREAYYSGRHAACLHHIRRYYEHDVGRLFGEERTGRPA